MLRKQRHDDMVLVVENSNCLMHSPGLHNTPGSARVVGLILFVLFCVF